MKFSPVLSVLSILLVSIVIIFAVAKIWMPDAIDTEIFVKLVLSFAVLALGSIVIQVLQGNKKAEEDTKEEK